MITTIKFVGLIVTTLLTSPNPPGAQLIMGNFPISDPPHVRLIAWPQGTRVNPDAEWPKAGSFIAVNQVTYDYSLVTTENVTITGTSEPFVNLLGKIPQLTCCCLPFNDGFKPAWGDPAYSGPDKMSAFFTFTHGTYFTVKESTNAISTALAIGESGNITFEGVLPGSVKKIVINSSLQPLAALIVANTPLAVLEGNPIHSPDTNDFPNYYLMGAATQTCDNSPGNSPLCAPSDKGGGCPIVVGRKHPTPAVSHARHKLRGKLLVKKAWLILKDTVLMVDVNCSSSQWP